jgi:transposase
MEDQVAADEVNALGARVRLLYCSGMSTRQVANVLGVSRRRVEQTLHTSGVDIAPRGAGRARRARRRPDRDDLAERLHELYVRQRLTRRQVAQVLGVSEGVIRARLAQHGITTRTRGRCYREDRRDLPEQEVARLYRDSGLTADAAAALLGVSRATFLRAAHEHGIAVRPSAVMASRSEPIELIDTLYADALVSAVLRRHGVPEVPPGGPIWQRFPKPVPLTPQLCRELYVEGGVATTHIELLTGNPEYRVRAALQSAGVQPRLGGGRSPFLRRREANCRAQSGSSGCTRGVVIVTPPRVLCADAGLGKETTDAVSHFRAVRVGGSRLPRPADVAGYGRA